MVLALSIVLYLKISCCVCCDRRRTARTRVMQERTSGKEVFTHYVSKRYYTRQQTNDRWFLIQSKISHFIATNCTWKTVIDATLFLTLIYILVLIYTVFWLHELAILLSQISCKKLLLLKSLLFLYYSVNRKVLAGFINNLHLNFVARLVFIICF
jgi:hypothetical protein